MINSGWTRVGQQYGQISRSNIAIHLAVNSGAIALPIGGSRLRGISADGDYYGTIRSPNGDINPLDEVKVSGDHLHLSADKLDVSFDGVWDDGLKAWVGNLVKGQKFALNLIRSEATDQARSVPRRPQEAALAAGPLPYDLQDVSFDNTAAQVKLAGSFSVPKGKGSFPAIVFIAGPGPNTRDEEVYGHKVFLILADARAARTQSPISGGQHRITRRIW